ncbi:MAG: hypothetical protein QOF30_1977, partial [Acidimicrobiaceae bacterium]|nr:hypothetical protein [Acidimicrobiaceae bacterium]
ISTVTRGGTTPGDYTTTNDHCTGATITPGANCTVAVTFAPTAAGTRSATVAITDNATGSPHSATLTGQGVADRGVLTYPLNGQSGVDTTRAFTWATAPAGQGYILVIGTTQHGTDLLNSGILSATQASIHVPALPSDRTLYATLLTETNGAWTLYQDITFTAATASATFTNPLNGQSGVDTTRAFTWTTAPAGQGYILVIGTTQHGTDVLDSGILSATQTSINVPALPTNRTLYATLLTETNGAWTLYQDITFTAAPGLATFTNPVNGQANVARSPTFSWSTIAQAQGYVLVVGTTKHGSDLVNSGVLPASRSSFSGLSLPAGTTLYATLLTETNGAWTRYQDIVFTTA